MVAVEGERVRIGADEAAGEDVFTYAGVPELTGITQEAVAHGQQAEPEDEEDQRPLVTTHAGTSTCAWAGCFGNNHHARPMTGATQANTNDGQPETASTTMMALMMP